VGVLGPGVRSGATGMRLFIPERKESCNALNLGVEFFSSSFLSPNSGVTLSFSLFFSLSLDLFQKL
jgi:hypothetical protein